jgi:hypothetical protein
MVGRSIVEKFNWPAMEEANDRHAHAKRTTTCKTRKAQPDADDEDDDAVNAVNAEEERRRGEEEKERMKMTRIDTGR